VTTILLARHGESDWNVELRWQGHADRPLTRRGRAQAAALADRLATYPLAAIYSSDLRRALDTARAVADRHGIDVVTRRDLREVDVGSWSGRSRAELESRFPEQIARWENGAKGWDDGESYEQMAARIIRAVGEIAAQHPGDHVLVVSHGGSVRAVHAHALGMEFHAYRRSAPVEPNARLSAVSIENGTFRLLHLRDEL
jgi:2,3-bisphosphoglycerate-dependent phosphoglycerate mutase